MRKFILSTAASIIVAVAAYAQSQAHQEAQSLLERAGVQLEIPADATDDQLSQIIAVAQNPGSPEHLEFEVKKILGME